MTYIEDLISNEQVRSLEQFIQHKHINRLQHSLSVSYKSFRICKWLGLDQASAARGGLLHDFFLYDWETEDRPTKMEHGALHPKIALENASKHFELNDREKDIIVKHMWPLTISLPKCKEAWVIIAMDKYCAITEFLNVKNKAAAGKFLSRVDNEEVEMSKAV